MLIGSTNKLSKSTLLLVTGVASGLIIWIYFVSAQNPLWWNWILYIGFQIDLDFNGKAKTGHRTPGVSKWRERFTLLSLLVTLLLIESRILLATFATKAHYWLGFTLQPTSGSLSAELLPREWAPDSIVAHG